MGIRVTEIDGMRGWAALCVLLFHLTWELFGEIFPGFRSVYLRFFLDGQLAVCVFFILSGDALSSTFIFPEKLDRLPRVAIKRYFRLMVPILFSALIVYFLMKMGLVFNRDAGTMVNRSDWLGAFLAFEPSLLGVFYFGALNVFASQAGESSYNPFMWPMGIELIGSFIIFSFGTTYRYLKSPIAVILVCIVWLWILRSPFCLFFIGVLFGVLRQHGFFERIRNHQLNRSLSVLLFLLIVIFDAMSEKYDFRTASFLFSISLITVLCCYASKDVICFMQNRLSRFMGKISFPLYFMQFSMIVSYTSWVIVFGAPRFGGSFFFPMFVILSSVMLVIAVASFVAVLEQFFLDKLDLLTGRLFK